ncbi:MAG TPA: acryloyl-CoA reductase [Acidimicrobiales bacterium]|nr:acryloyl-CoA reductase [Acidimicrobiales bacterium]
MRAFVVELADGEVTASVRDVDPDSWLEGDVEVAVEWSCLNFKDAMVVAPAGRVTRLDRLIGGVDAAGSVLGSRDPSMPVGTLVVAHGHGFGTAHHGGFASRLRADATWLTVLPEGLDARSSMVFGTAGYTAMASVLELELRVAPGAGEVLVTGATGGVGSVSVALLAARGHDVTALSRKESSHEFLGGLGAARVVSPEALADRPDRVLGSARFAGAIDCVGGETLAGILRVLRWGGVAVATGLVGGAALATTVYPFITRGVSLVGVDSVEAPGQLRSTVWAALAGSLGPATLEALVDREVGLDGIADGLGQLDRGDAHGRILVDPNR